MLLLLDLGVMGCRRRRRVTFGARGRQVRHVRSRRRRGGGTVEMRHGRPAGLHRSVSLLGSIIVDKYCLKNLILIPTNRILNVPDSCSQADAGAREVLEWLEAASYPSQMPLPNACRHLLLLRPQPCYRRPAAVAVDAGEGCGGDCGGGGHGRPRPPRPPQQQTLHPRRLGGKVRAAWWA